MSVPPSHPREAIRYEDRGGCNRSHPPVEFSAFTLINNYEAGSQPFPFSGCCAAFRISTPVCHRMSFIVVDFDSRRHQVSPS